MKDSLKKLCFKLPSLFALTLLLPSVNPGALADVNLIGFYTFDNSSFLGTDFSGHGHDLTVGGGAPVYTATGASQGGVTFNGTSWFVFPPSMIAQIADDFSVSLWLKTTQLSGTNSDEAYIDTGVVWADASGLTSSSIPMALTGSKLAFFTGNPNSTVHSAANINMGSFVHLAVTRQKSTGQRKVYVNGVLNATDVGGSNSLTAPTELLLGMNHLNSHGLIGTVDDVQIFSGVLDPLQVAYLHNYPGNPAPPLSLLTLPLSTSFDGTNFQFSFTSIPNYDHAVESTTNITTGPWQNYTNITGDGDLKTIVVPVETPNRLFFRIGSQPAPQAS